MPRFQSNMAKLLTLMISISPDDVRNVVIVRKTCQTLRLPFNAWRNMSDPWYDGDSAGSKLIRDLASDLEVRYTK